MSDARVEVLASVSPPAEEGTSSEPPAPLAERAEEAVPAGFPSPAQGYYSGPVDLNRHLINDPAATFIVRVSGDSMIGAGIFDGDEIIGTVRLWNVSAGGRDALLLGPLAISPERQSEGLGGKLMRAATSVSRSCRPPTNWA